MNTTANKVNTGVNTPTTESGKVFGCWYTRDEVATMLANGKELYYTSALTLRVTEA